MTVFPSISRLMIYHTQESVLKLLVLTFEVTLFNLFSDFTGEQTFTLNKRVLILQIGAKLIKGIYFYLASLHKKLTFPNLTFPILRAAFHSNFNL